MDLVERLAKSTPQGATTACGGDFVTREQLASALRRSLHYIQQSKKVRFFRFFFFFFASVTSFLAAFFMESCVAAELPF